MLQKHYSGKEDHRLPQISTGACGCTHSVCKDSDEFAWIWAELLQVALGLGEGRTCWAHAQAHKEASGSQGDHTCQPGQDGSALRFWPLPFTLKSVTVRTDMIRSPLAIAAVERAVVGAGTVNWVPSADIRWGLPGPEFRLTWITNGYNQSYKIIQRILWRKILF